MSSTLAYVRATAGLHSCVHATDAAKASCYKHGIIKQGMAHRRRFASTSGSTSGSSSDEDPELELDSVSEY